VGELLPDWRTFNILGLKALRFPPVSSRPLPKLAPCPSLPSWHDLNLFGARLQRLCVCLPVCSAIYQKRRRGEAGGLWLPAAATAPRFCR